jgi:hypothetical protein
MAFVVSVELLSEIVRYANAATDLINNKVEAPFLHDATTFLEEVRSEDEYVIFCGAIDHLPESVAQVGVDELLRVHRKNGPNSQFNYLLFLERGERIRNMIHAEFPSTVST